MSSERRRLLEELHGPLQVPPEARALRIWSREAGSGRFFMSAEDLTMQAGFALQQDPALVSILGLSLVERNGRHYVNGMAGLPSGEQPAFLAAPRPLREELRRGAGAHHARHARHRIARRAWLCERRRA